SFVAARRPLRRVADQLRNDGRLVGRVEQVARAGAVHPWRLHPDLIAVFIVPLVSHVAGPDDEMAARLEVDKRTVGFAGEPDAERAARREVVTPPDDVRDLGGEDDPRDLDLHIAALGDTVHSDAQVARHDLLNISPPGSTLQWVRREPPSRIDSPDSREPREPETRRHRRPP